MLRDIILRLINVAWLHGKLLKVKSPVQDQTYSQENDLISWE